MKNTLLLFSLLGVTLLNAQVDRNDQLYKTLFSKDSLLFNVGFNTCDIDQFEALVSEDFEFYHDQSGVTPSKAAFLEGTRNGLCQLNYQPLRILDEESLEVFPLKNNGRLYGAVQKGAHRFYAKYPDGKNEFTSMARFTHIWMIENEEWKLSRVLSYDHRSPGE